MTTGRGISGAVSLSHAGAFAESMRLAPRVRVDRLVRSRPAPTRLLSSNHVSRSSRSRARFACDGCCQPERRGRIDRFEIGREDTNQAPHRGNPEVQRDASS
jgi:hypothetical protein